MERPQHVKPGVSSTGEWRNEKGRHGRERDGMGHTREYGGRVNGVEVILQTKTALRGKGRGEETGYKPQ